MKIIFNENLMGGSGKVYNNDPNPQGRVVVNHPVSKHVKHFSKQPKDAASKKNSNHLLPNNKQSQDGHEKMDFGDDDGATGLQAKDIKDEESAPIDY